MSAYFDEYGNPIEPQQQPNFDPVNQAFWTNPAEVVALAAKLAADQAAASVGQAVYAEQGWQLEQARVEAAKVADLALTERFGAEWLKDKQRFAEEWIAPRPEFLAQDSFTDGEALAASLGQGYRLWKSEAVEGAERLQALEDKEFADDLLRLHRDSTYSARMSNADFQRALREVQGGR